jgi:response regulator receiver domain
MENIIFYTSNRHRKIQNIQGVKLIPIIENTKELNTDKYINEKIIKELEEKEYDNIFIPLSPLYSFSDYLGLYIALMIKVSNTKNKLANIFIYGTEFHGDVSKNKYFQATQFKEVDLIEYSRSSIEQHLSDRRSCTEEEWFRQVNQINIPVPSNYYDNHSIANEWGIYQIVRNAGINIENITKFDKDKMDSLYFKWLIAKNRLFESIPEFQKQEQREYRYRLETNLKPTGEKIDLSKFSPKKENKQEKILLIDDLADKGWEQVLEETVTKNPIDIAENIEKAKEKIKEKYDLIFLDMRLGETDHKSTLQVEDFGGFNLLKEMKNDFRNINFSTPIILITASNKIWNIDKFKEHGVDFYYIKEHPNYVYSKEYSIENLRQLQKNFEKCIEINQNRNKIWILCNEIIGRIEGHSYFKSQDKRYVRVKERIIDKIKLGYYYLFKRPTGMEQKILLVNNEAMAFIVFWSILEEIVKGYTDIDETWRKVRNEKEEIEYKWTGNWKFRNGEDFILDKKEVCQNKMISNKEERESKQDQKEDHKIYQEEKHINLSSQVRVLLNCYILDKQRREEIRKKFKEINEYRNQVDYIHSSVLSIFTKGLIDKEQTKECFKKNEEVLHLIIDILENS